MSSTSGVVDVRSDSDVVLTFDKAVSVSDGWFTVMCDDGEGGSSTAVTGLEVTTPTSGSATDNVEYTIGAPSDGYVPESVCVLNIEASRVVDATYTRETLSSVADFKFTIYKRPEVAVSVTQQDDSAVKHIWGVGCEVR